MHRDFKGIWIPKEIWLIPGLKPMYRIFLSEIDSLDTGNGCYAENEHFSKLFGLSKNRCSEIITMLNEKGYIVITREGNGRGGERRILRLVSSIEKPKGASENRLTPSENRLHEYDEKYMSIYTTTREDGQICKKIDLQTATNMIKENRSLLESIISNTKLKEQTILTAVPDFFNWISGLEKKYNNRGDFFSHFGSWIRKQDLKDRNVDEELSWFMKMFNTLSRKHFVSTDHIRKAFVTQFENGFTGPQMRVAVENLYSPHNKWHRERKYEFATPEFLLKDGNLNKYLNMKF